MEESSSRTYKRFSSFNHIRALLVTSILLGAWISISLMATTVISKEAIGKQPYRFLPFNETTYSFVKDFEVKDDVFSMKGSSFKIEKSDSSPENGQVSTPKGIFLNEGLLITFEGSINEKLVFSEPKMICYDAFEYDFEFDNKAYKLFLGAVDGCNSEDIKVAIYEPSDMDIYGYHNYVSVAYFSK